MRAAVIGANSYIARNLIQMNRSGRYAEVSLFDCQPEHMDHESGYRQIDPFRQSDLQQAVEGYDLVYFFTGKTGTLQGFDDPGLFVDVNEKCLLSLLNACRAVHTKAKIVFPSTRLVYRGDDVPLKEEARKQFLTPYAVQKYACEQYLEMYRQLFGVDYCILRIGVPYGTMVYPVFSYGTLDFFLNQARDEGMVVIYGDGSQRRTFTYIGDLCRILWRAGLEPDCRNDVYNIGGEDRSIREIAHMVAGAEGAEVIEREWPDSARRVETGSTVFDSSKLDGLLREPPEMTVDAWVHGADKTEGGKETEMKDAVVRTGAEFAGGVKRNAGDASCIIAVVLSLQAAEGCESGQKGVRACA